MADTAETIANIESYRFESDGDIPNNPALPLLVYRSVLPLDGDAAAACKRLFARNRWPGAWRNGVYGYHHFHSAAHEVLGFVRGEARLRFGGKNGRIVTMRAGDVVVIPAGVGHKNEGATDDLVVVGAYPAGQDWDLCPSRPDERDCAQNKIRSVPLPEADPVYGAHGPLHAHWRIGR